MEKAHKKTVFENELEKQNQEILQSGVYDDDEGTLGDQLKEAAQKFIEIDEHCSGSLTMIDLKRVFEKVGQAKTHLELVKIMNDIAPGKERIEYSDFVRMMLGKSGQVLRLVLKFNSFAAEPEKPRGIAKKKTFDDLP